MKHMQKCLHEQSCLVEVTRSNELCLCRGSQVQSQLASADNWKTVSFNPALNVNQGRIKPQKERDGLHLSYAIPKIQWASSPHFPMASRLWKLLPLLLSFKVSEDKVYIFIGKGQKHLFLAYGGCIKIPCFKAIK